MPLQILAYRSYSKCCPIQYNNEQITNSGYEIVSQMIAPNDCFSNVQKFWYMYPFVTEGISHTPRTIKKGIEEIELVVSGHAICEIKNSIVSVGPGDIIWHCAGDKTIHTNSESEEYCCFVVVFDVDETKRNTTVPRLSHWNGPIGMQQFILDLQFRFKRALPQQLNRIGQYVYTMLQTQADFSENSREDQQPLKLNDVAEFISNKRDNISVHDIATFLDVSDSHCHYMFQQEFNKSPYQYILDIRMLSAANELEESSKQIKLIAFENGFQSVSGFSKAFKKYFQTSPNVYRESNRIVIE